MYYDISNKEPSSSKQLLPPIKHGYLEQFPIIESTYSITSVANFHVLVLPNGVFLTKWHYIGYVCAI